MAGIAAAGSTGAGDGAKDIDVATDATLRSEVSLITVRSLHGGDKQLKNGAMVAALDTGHPLTYYGDSVDDGNSHRGMLLAPHKIAPDSRLHQ